MPASVNIDCVDSVHKHGTNDVDGDVVGSEKAIEPIINWNDLRYSIAVGKRNDCKNMIYTEDEHNLYGRNRELKCGEVAYLCRLYHKKGCKSRLYLKNKRLYKKSDFIAHNHPPQDVDHDEFCVESRIKDECGDLAILVNARTQSSAVTEIFDRQMKL